MILADAPAASNSVLIAVVSGLFSAGGVTALITVFNNRKQIRLQERAADQADEMGPIERESLQVKTAGEAVAMLAKAADSANARAESAEARTAACETQSVQMREELQARIARLTERVNELQTQVYLLQNPPPEEAHP